MYRILSFLVVVHCLLLRGAWGNSELIVKFSDFKSFAGAAVQTAEVVELKHLLPEFEIYCFRVKKGVNVLLAQRALEKLPGVEYVEIDRPIEIETISLKNFTEKIQSFPTLQAYQEPILVAVVDSGIDYNHPVLAPLMWKNPNEVPGNGRDDDQNGYPDDIRGWNFAHSNSEPMDDHGHGTHVAGIVAGLDSDVNSNPVRLMPVKFLSQSGEGTTVGALLAVQYALAMGARILNLSWTGSGSRALFDVFVQSYHRGTLVVTAAGNRRMNIGVYPVYPASFPHPNIVSVASLTSSGNLSLFSNYGPASVDIGAPGEQIWSSLPNGGYGFKTGTSMSAPYVARTLALLWSLNPRLTSIQVRQVLLETTEQNPSLRPYIGSGGTIDFQQAVATAHVTLPASSLPPYYPTEYPSGLEDTFEAASAPGCGAIDTGGDNGGPKHFFSLIFPVILILIWKKKRDLFPA